MKSTLGILLIISGLFDVYKYRWETQKIQELKSSKGVSRKFLVVALINDLVRCIYGLVIRDLPITLTAVLALYFMSECYYTVYIYYPYRYRGLRNFRRPNFLVFLINSLIPNRWRRRL